MAISDHTPIQLPLAIEHSTFEIPLAHGRFAIVDALDADLCVHKWVAAPEKTGNAYARAWSKMVKGERHHLIMHRIILARQLNRELKPEEFVDHIDGDGLNNRRSNLRLASTAENGRNRKINSNNTSGANGVSWDAHNHKWRALIYLNGKKIHIGLFDDLHEAVKARKVVELKLYGEYSALVSRSDHPDNV